MVRATSQGFIGSLPCGEFSSFSSFTDRFKSTVEGTPWRKTRFISLWLSMEQFAMKVVEALLLFCDWEFPRLVAVWVCGEASDEGHKVSDALCKWMPYWRVAVFTWSDCQKHFSKTNNIHKSLFSLHSQLFPLGPLFAVNEMFLTAS